MFFMDIFLAFSFGGYPGMFMTNDKALNNRIRVKLRSACFLVYFFLFEPMFAYFATRWSDWNWYYMFDSYAYFFNDSRILVIVFLAPFYFSFFWIGFICTEALIVAGKRRFAKVLHCSIFLSIGISHAIILRNIFFYPGSLVEYEDGDHAALNGFSNLEWLCMQMFYPAIPIVALLVTPYIAVNPALIWDHTHQAAGLNWSGRFQLSNMHIEEPTTEEEIVEIVKRCGKEGVPVRAVGSMHSFVPNWDTGSEHGVTIRLRKYNKLLSADALTGLVTAQAGMTLHDGNFIFDQMGLAAGTLGTVGWQTIAGAMSTGTHGPSLTEGSVGTMAVAFRIVLASGEVKEVNKGEPLFDAVGMSLGMLGIISTVTLKLVPAHYLRATEYVLSFEDWCMQYKELAKKHKFVRCLWYMAPGLVDVMVMDEVSDTQEGENDVTKYWNRDTNFKWLWMRISCYINSNLVPRCLYPLVQRSAINPRHQRVCVDRSFEILNIDMNLSLRHDECELAVPFESVVDACKKLYAHCKATGHWHQMPVELRPTAQDQFLLSPSGDGPVVYIDLFYYFFGPFTAKKDQPMRFFKEMTEALDEFSPRPHWGKFNSISPEQTVKRFPGLLEFLELRQELDPNRLFASAYFDEHFDACRRSTGDSARLSATDEPVLPIILPGALDF